jgi:hypothetical protein
VLRAIDVYSLDRMINDEISFLTLVTYPIRREWDQLTADSGSILTVTLRAQAALNAFSKALDVL